MRPVFLVSALGALLLAVIYLSEWLSTFLIIGGILAGAFGLASQIVHLVTSNFPAVYTRPTPEHEAIHRYHMVSTHSLLQYFPYSGKIRVGF
jgi:hypothetical protein